jgi:DNA-binding MarR family transcriptional regulator
MISEFNEPKQSPGFLLWQVTSIWQRNIRNALTQVDLTHVQFVLLATCQWLNENETSASGVTQIQLSQLSQVDVNVTSQVLRTLERKKLLKRNPHPVDMRANVITLTDEGNLIVSKALTIVEQVDRNFFSVTGSQKDKLIEFLVALSKN